jgi:hypothetical protein
LCHQMAGCACHAQGDQQDETMPNFRILHND